jgi:hypothetical protein
MCFLEYRQNWNKTCVNVINEKEEQGRDDWLMWVATGSNVDRDTDYFECPCSGAEITKG